MTTVFLVHHLLREAARRYPDNDAVIMGKEHVTYRSLDELSDGLANTLKNQRLRRGDRVVLYLQKSIASIVSIYGTLKAGGCYVPVDPKAPPARCGQIIRDSGAAFLLSTPSLARTMQAELKGSTIRSIVLLNGESADPFKNETGLLQQDFSTVVFRGATPDSSERSLDLQATENDTANIVYTSGSTGTPKGVMLSHRSLLVATNLNCDVLELTPSDRVACQMPLSFSLSVVSIFGSCETGAALVLVPESSAVFPSELAKLIESQEVSVWISVSSALTLFGLYGNLGSCDLSALRAIVFGGERFPAKHLSHLMTLIPSARFFQFFGLTETNATTHYEVKNLDPGQVSPIPIGKPYENSEVFALDDKGRLLKRSGEKGELYVGGPMVTNGYWGDPERTARSLVKNPLRPDSADKVFKTGDIVTLDHDGNYVHLGRGDGVVKTRGCRVELGEVEAIMYTHPAVKEVAVVPIPDDSVGNLLIAFASLQEESNAKLEDLLAHCSQKLPRYMVPSSIELRDSLPRTATGKIDKSSLAREAIAKKGARTRPES